MKRNDKINLFDRKLKDNIENNFLQMNISMITISLSIHKTQETKIKYPFAFV